ncbi:MAG TPA: hypothetical protein VGQ29_08075 [Gemmatimonadales bacterium]|jgi:hypothetical protein|nr:hypothetical protein [Gemmatimonadales bacterium]
MAPRQAEPGAVQHVDLGPRRGTVALASGTIWHLVLVHWLLNVGMDFVIWRGG